MQHLTLIAVLAWVGLGADALSSSAYGPEEAFKTIGVHTHLAVPLALATAMTVFLISAAYSKVIEAFPNGGGYGVSSRLLGPRVGVVSGSALLVDYILTITASLAAMGDALFSLLPAAMLPWKLPVEAAAVIVLTVLNLRGVRESIMVLTPIFLLFLITHVVLIGGGLAMQAPAALATADGLHQQVTRDLADPSVGLLGLMALLLHAYAMGGGTYTGIEAVSNALPLMREPRVQTAKRTMLYMSISLAITAGGLIFCYLLWTVTPVEGKTMNAVLAERFSAGWPGGQAFVVATLVAEALLLVVAAQAGFVGGPRVMANMAVDSWLPRHFATLSDRLITENGVLFMGGAALLALLFTGGSVDTIVVMYSINVFLTFTLTMVGMCRFWWDKREDPARTKRLLLFGFNALLCGSILVVTVIEKFAIGGWVTVVVTGGLSVLCFVIHAHYRTVAKRIVLLYRSLDQPLKTPSGVVAQPAPNDTTAVVLVGAYGGPGIHTTLNVFKSFPRHFKNLVFVSVGVADSGDFKGADTVELLRERTEDALRRYVALAASLGIPATSRMAIGTDAVEEAVQVCRAVKKDFPQSTFFAGKVLFEREVWYHRLLHNETAFTVQKRLQWDGLMTVVVPIRLPK